MKMLKKLVLSLSFAVGLVNTNLKSMIKNDFLTYKGETVLNRLGDPITAENIRTVGFLTVNSISGMRVASTRGGYVSVNLIKSVVDTNINDQLTVVPSSNFLAFVNEPNIEELNLLLENLLYNFNQGMAYFVNAFSNKIEERLYILGAITTYFNDIIRVRVGIELLKNPSVATEIIFDNVIKSSKKEFDLLHEIEELLKSDLNPISVGKKIKTSMFSFMQDLHFAVKSVLKPIKYASVLGSSLSIFLYETANTYTMNPLLEALFIGVDAGVVAYDVILHFMGVDNFSALVSAIRNKEVSVSDSKVEAGVSKTFEYCEANFN